MRLRRVRGWGAPGELVEQVLGPVEVDEVPGEGGGGPGEPSLQPVRGVDGAHPPPPVDDPPALDEVEAMDEDRLKGMMKAMKEAPAPAPARDEVVDEDKLKGMNVKRKEGVEGKGLTFALLILKITFTFVLQKTENMEFLISKTQIRNYLFPKTKIRNSSLNQKQQNGIPYFHNENAEFLILKLTQTSP